MPITEIAVSEYDTLLAKAATKKIPVCAMFELTYKCNFHCLMCYNAPQDKRELTTEEVNFILDELAEEGCLYLSPTGGEIMVRKDIFEILAYAVKKGFQIRLKSNAALLSPERIDRLQALGIGQIEVSFHGADAAHFEGITQVKGSYERTKAVIEELARRKFLVKLNLVAMTLNADQITPVREWARSIGVPFSFTTEVSPKTNQDKAPLQYRLSPEMRQLTANKQVPQDPKRRLEFYQMRLKGPTARSELFSCGVGKSQVIVSPYGEARLCLDIEEPSYSILELGLKEAWQRLLKFVEKTDVRRWQCPQELRPFCTGWCPARGLLDTGSLYGCDDHCQELARLNQKEYESLLEQAQREGWEASGAFKQKPEQGCEFRD